MSFFKEIPTPRKPEQTEEEKKNDCQHEEKSEDSNRILESESGNKSSSDLSEALNLVFKRCGLIEETADKKKSDTSESPENIIFNYLEQGEDGKYYDKETGKAYDSIEAWIKIQEDLVRQYEREAKVFEREAKKEWSQFENSDQNEEYNDETLKHYQKFLEYFSKAEEAQEMADHIREKLMHDINIIFKDSPAAIKTFVDAFSKDLSVKRIKKSDTISICNYINQTIRMESNLDYDEYKEDFIHEYGHFVDDMLRWPSKELITAMEEDLAQYDLSTTNGIENFERMMDDLMKSDAAYDKAVSDILSAFFNNASAVKQRYEAMGISGGRHDNGYWCIPGKREAEVFADLFSIVAQNNSDSCNFIKNYFPNTWKQFMTILEGGL